MPSKPPTHKPPGWKPRQAWAKAKPTPRLTGRPWRRLRAEVLKRDNHLCRVCDEEGRLTIATEVDHVKPLAEGGTDDLQNLQAICAEHHQAKSQAEAKRGLRRG